MSNETMKSLTAPYIPLDNSRQGIRVLIVQPGQGSDPIKCTTKHVSLLEIPAPVFETISYCWGPRQTPVSIVLNDRPTLVPPSSDAALRRMRLVDRERRLWIDAICIDQSSLPERSAQVALMSRIYSLATQNLIYLGEDDGVAARAYAAIEVVLEDMRGLTNDFTSTFDILLEKSTGASHYAKEGFSAEVYFDALEVMFKLPWFRRLWVLQEAALAVSSLCHWGSIEFPLLDVVRVARWLIYRFRFIPDSLYDCAGWRCASEMWDFIDKDSGYHSKRRTLASMMELPQRFEKTEPKDSIYAILGLLDSELTSKNEHVELIHVDYAKSLGGVLRDATRYALCQTQDLAVFRRVNHPGDDLPKDKEIPTWAVRAHLLRDPQDISLFPLFFNACKGLDPPTLLHDTSHGLGVLMGQGILVDEVTETTTTCDGFHWHEYGGYHEWLALAKNMLLKHSICTTQKSMMRVLSDMAHALTNGEAYNRKRACSDDLVVLTDYLRDIQGVQRRDSVLETQQDKNTDHREEKMDEMYAASRVTACLRRRFYVTSQNRMGLGPRSMRSGDLVVVLRGGQIPYILRRKNNSCQLVGPAYLHGMMDGEASLLQDAPHELSEQIFSVC